MAAAEPTGSVPSDIETRGINVIRGLAMDAVQKANSGHPGTPMALAPLAHVLLTRVMTYDAADPHWPDRDRFVLSNGHASMLLYSMLYLTGFGLELDDIEQFRQWGSRTPGHPEYGHAPGVEVTTGPLGQGIANAVGLALAEANLRARFGPEVTDHHVFAICSDGDLEEGVSHEAASLAGHLGLGRLVAVYDDNHITIDGPTELALTDDPVLRFSGLRLARRRARRGGERPRRARARGSARAWRKPTGRASSCCAATSAARRRASPIRRRRTARRSAKTRSARSRRSSACRRTSTSSCPTTCSSTTAAAGRGGPPGSVGEAPRTGLRDAEPGLAEDYAACIEGRGIEGWESKLPTWSPGDAVATRQACSDGARRDRRRRARARRRRRRPHRQHRHEAARGRRRDRHPRLPRSPDPLRDPRARHGRRHERDGRRRPAAVRRHVLRVQRLHARRGAGRRAVGLQGGVRLVARLDRAR